MNGVGVSFVASRQASPRAGSGWPETADRGLWNLIETAAAGSGQGGLP